MPDYKRATIYGHKIGSHLAKMLRLLQGSYNDYTYSRQQSALVVEHVEVLGHVEIQKLTLKEVSKQGNTITIRYKVRLQPNAANINKAISLLFSWMETRQAPRPMTCLRC